MQCNEGIEKNPTAVLVGKYTSGTDAYLSVEKALQHAAIAVNRKLQIQVNLLLLVRVMRPRGSLDFGVNKDLAMSGLAAAAVDARSGTWALSEPREESDLTSPEPI